MKKMYLTLLSLLSVATLMCSCGDPANKDDGKVEVTEKYEITFGGMYDMSVTSETPAMVTLREYAEDSYDKMVKKSGKAEWTITVRDFSIEAASAEADKQAIEIFNSMITQLNTALDQYKVDFEAKRGELAAQIVTYPTNRRVRVENMTPTLNKELIAPTNAYFDTLKTGDKKVTVEAIGGTQY